MLGAFAGAAGTREVPLLLLVGLWGDGNGQFSVVILSCCLLAKQKELINVCGLNYSGMVSAAAFKLLDPTAKRNGF